MRGNAAPQLQIALRRQCVPMVGTHHPNIISQQFFEFVDRSGDITRLASPQGEVVPGGKGVRMLRAQYPHSVGE